MTMNAFAGSFNIDTSKTATQTQAITGVGFTPKIVLFWWSGTTQSSDGARGEDVNAGFGAISGATSRWCVGGSSDDAAGTSACSRYEYQDSCIRSYLNGTTTLDGAADFSSFDADGFTLVIDDQFSTALRVSYLALGGDDLTNVYLGTFTQPNTTGNYSVTGVGFQPDALIMATDFVNFAVGATTDWYFTLGLGTGASNQGVVAGTSRDAQATSYSRGYGYNGEILAHTAFGLPQARDALVSMDADGFTLNELEAGVAGIIYFVALKGGQYHVGDIDTRTDGNDIAETAPGFQPVALLFASANRALSTQNATTNNHRASIGAATSTTNRAAQAWSDENNLADTETATANYDTACYAHVADDAIVALMNIKSIDATGFTAVMDDVETVASWVTYLAIGAAAAGTAIKDVIGMGIIPWSR